MRIAPRESACLYPSALGSTEPLVTEIPPVRIGFGGQLQLSHSHSTCDPLHPRDGIANLAEWFGVDETIDPAARREASNESL
jgi:hypothetical protein